MEQENKLENKQEDKKETQTRLVGDYIFQDPEQAVQAQKEQTYISKLKKNMNPEDVESLYHLYMKLTEKGYFHTPVGFHFLAEMYDYLTGNGYRLDERPIPVISEKKVTLDKEKKLMRENARLYEENEKSKREVERLSLIRIRLIIAVAALAALVIGMIFIAVTNKNTGYFRAEEKVQDKYSYWEESLDEREKKLQEWEDELQEEAQKLEDSKTQN